MVVFVIYFSQAADPTLSIASADSNATCLDNTVFVDMTLKPTSANADSATAVMDAVDALPTRGLKKVVKRLADPGQSGTKWSAVLKDYINAVRTRGEWLTHDCYFLHKQL